MEESSRDSLTYLSLSIASASFISQAIGFTKYIIALVSAICLLMASYYFIKGLIGVKGDLRKCY